MNRDSVITGVWVAILGVGLIAGLVSASSDLRNGRVHPLPVKEKPNMEKATFGAGCFWGVEEMFRKLDGVVDTDVGYMGGNVEEPTYREVCGGRSGHAEVCEVTFDPARISYATLLGTFWKIHDPTQVNRQGPDVGCQYRSAIFFHSEEQKAEAEKSKAELDKSGKLEKPVATAIEKAAVFWRAEEHHQEYFKKNGGGGCQLPGR